METDSLIKVEHLSKKFTSSIKRSLFYGSQDVARSMLGLAYDTGHLRKGEFWALEDINFELRRGETLGIIGVNGSGKSTLLRLLSGIFPPDKGRIAINGRIGSLIAVGSGFHPHMTGRENIYLNGTILGMTHDEIVRKFDQIVQFADIGSFLDAPVSTYSSGMSVRLGFAIAIHTEPDILLVDEILSVGDLSFRNKSLRRMSEYREKANGIIFISHNLEQVRTLCNRVIIMDKGRVIFDGSTQEGVVMYEEMSRNVRLRSISTEIQGNSSIRSSLGGYQSQEISVNDVGLLGKNGKAATEIALGEELTVFCDFETKADIGRLYFTVSILDDQWTKNIISVVSNDVNGVQFHEITPGKYRMSMSLGDSHLGPGVYMPQVSIRNDATGETYERVFRQEPFKVASDGTKLELGVINVDPKWSLSKE